MKIKIKCIIPHMTKEELGQVDAELETGEINYEVLDQLHQLAISMQLMYFQDANQDEYEFELKKQDRFKSYRVAPKSEDIRLINYGAFWEKQLDSLSYAVRYGIPCMAYNHMCWYFHQFQDFKSAQICSDIYYQMRDYALDAMEHNEEREDASDFLTFLD